MQRPRQLQRGAERVRHLHLLCLGRRRVLPRHGVQRLRGGLLRGQLHSGVPASFSVQRGLFIFNNFNNFNFNNIFFHVWPPFFASFSPEFFFTFLAALHSAVSPRFLRLLSQNVLLRAAVCLHRPPPPKGSASLSLLSHRRAPVVPHNHAPGGDSAPTASILAALGVKLFGPQCQPCVGLVRVIHGSLPVCVRCRPPAAPCRHSGTRCSLAVFGGRCEWAVR